MVALRKQVYQQLFARADATHGLTLFNKAIIIVILAAVGVTIIATEPAMFQPHREFFIGLEMLFGVIFGVEYLGRVWSIVEEADGQPAWKVRLHFVFTPLALIDLVVVVASLMPFFFSDVALLRVVRLIRLAALAKFGRFSTALRELVRALLARRYELLVTMALAACLLLFGASSLYWAERHVQPEAFGSIPRALWWAIITLTTVGYGDVSPITPLGKLLASVVALGGIGLVAMPTGIMASAFSDAMQRQRDAANKDGPDA
ncbi:ion transporter [Novosphingobium mangrovi (ex Huang et al. 2023)]|uniref:Ion transporter n=1 Tax=Novosphingobium mangrovi (ex Huang et al. 2023) TaxID=2976432 RepID=A0ABT2I0H1_9SPHN|nr:ion transporter [Novosphingobium mangrovi (ex Huang et al. 2023)]MCT2398097.1 ion transporter [Novosphingobium mangrovi (ex Huang et al. 2023)]